MKKSLCVSLVSLCFLGVLGALVVLFGWAEGECKDV
jgi:hypothetical protein